MVFIQASHYYDVTSSVPTEERNVLRSSTNSSQLALLLTAKRSGYTVFTYLLTDSMLVCLIITVRSRLFYLLLLILINLTL